MKSPMITAASYIEDKDNYTDMRVLKSGGGWYVGTIYKGEDFDEPGSRDTDYFATEDEAKAYLARLEAGEELPVRMRP